MPKNDKKIFAILLAAGSSTRFKEDKTFYKLENTPVAIKSFETLNSLELIDGIIIVSSDQNRYKFRKYIEENSFSKHVELITGSNTRAESMNKALDFIIQNKIITDYIIIHDAARPYASEKLYKKGTELLSKYDAIVPGLTPTDTVKLIDKSNLVVETLDRSKLINAQTPQFFNSKILIESAKKIDRYDMYTDDSSILENKSLKIKVISGEETNIKITTKNDVVSGVFQNGIGFDIHKLVKGNKLRLGALDINYPFTLEGHSDGDVLIHSIIDSILGSASLGDIGKYFPSNDKNLKGIDSTIMLSKIKSMIDKKNIQIINLDCTIIAQKPRMSDHVNKMKKNIAKILNIDENKVNIKSTTTDFLGIIGSEKSIAAQSICTVKILE
tara:strand:- start:12722 stop:13876 length:1155 start_codon:yes stop_codon:yes gene_type:complete